MTVATTGAGSSAGERARAGGDVGISLRQPHHAELLEAPPPVGFIELRSEDFFFEHGATDAHARSVLRLVCANYPVSLLGTGLALGTLMGPDAAYLERLAGLVERIDPIRVADQAGLARGTLTVAFTEAALARRISHLERVQERLRRPLLVENVWSLVAFSTDPASMSEPEFFSALCRRSGCGMVLDVNTLMVNALNAELPDPLAACRAFIDALPQGIVGEIQVGGFTEIGENGEVGEIVIANRGSRVRPEVWQLCAHALRRFGHVPVLVEWDVDLPALDVLLDEAAHAARLLNH